MPVVPPGREISSLEEPAAQAESRNATDVAANRRIIRYLEKEVPLAWHTGSSRAIGRERHAYRLAAGAGDAADEPRLRNTSLRSGLAAYGLRRETSPPVSQRTGTIFRAIVACITA